MERPSKWNGLRNIEEAVYMPEASVGTCTNVGNCGQVDIDLANGLCVFCWDKRTPTKNEQSLSRGKLLQLMQKYKKVQIFIIGTFFILFFRFYYFG